MPTIHPTRRAAPDGGPDYFGRQAAPDRADIAAARSSKRDEARQEMEVAGVARDSAAERLKAAERALAEHEYSRLVTARDKATDELDEAKRTYDRVYKAYVTLPALLDKGW